MPVSKLRQTPMNCMLPQQPAGELDGCRMYPSRFTPCMGLQKGTHPNISQIADIQGMTGNARNVRGSDPNDGAWITMKRTTKNPRGRMV
jgi:hypothetical protein